MWRYNWRTQESSQQDKIKKRQAILSATAAASLLLHEPHDIYAAFLIADRIASAQRARNRSTLAVERVIQADFVRDIFGNPFRPVTFDPRWRTSDVVGLARAIYDDKAFERIPILADALMDAGCEEEQIIGHCRGDGPHVRGCWVVDLVLGKE
jgi:hypothetical protein